MLQPYQHRVIKEKQSLDERLNRLRFFMSSPMYLGVPEVEQQRLKEQADLMHKLSEVLQQRIESFTDGQPGSVATSIGDSDVRMALAKAHPLETIGQIISTDLHPNTTGRMPAPEVSLSFWGKFDLEGLALAEVAPIELRKHLIHAIGRMEGYAKDARPAGYVGVVALRAGS